MSNIIFETDRLIVMQYKPEDIDNFFALNGDKEIMEFIRQPRTKEECVTFLNEIISSYAEDASMGHWGTFEKSSGKYVGTFAFIPVKGTPDYQLGYALLKEYWGKGFATEMLLEGIRHAFETTKLNKIYGITEAAHVTSQKVLLKAGFTLFQSYQENGKKMTKFILKRG